MSRFDPPRDPGAERTTIERVDPLVGSVLDNRFRIDFRLAAGGFGAIYRATHVKSGHQVALKVLHTELATSDARVIARFRREGATLEQLRSPHTITAYELGEAADGTLYIVMELLHGESLYELFRARGALPWKRVVAIGRQVCSSLAEAHSLGIIHRDLKPANIHLEKRDGQADFVKVLDFGIAKIIRDGQLDTSELTQAGQMIGTFDYMAPEQMVGGECTPATDIYTLGVVMYEMIAGVRPFHDAQSTTSMLAALLTQDAPPLGSHCEVPPELDRIMRKCLEREPQNRYGDVADLSADLGRLLASDENETKMVAATPAPQPHDEVTVIDTRQRASLPPRRDTAAPHVVRRPPTGTPLGTPDPDRRASAHVIPRDRRDSSQPPFDPNARMRRESTPGPVRRDSAKAEPARVRRDSSQPPFEPRKAQRTPTPPPTPVPAARSAPVPQSVDDAWADTKPTNPQGWEAKPSARPAPDDPGWYDSKPTDPRGGWHDPRQPNPFKPGADARPPALTLPLPKVADARSPVPAGDPMRPSNPVMVGAPIVRPSPQQPYGAPMPHVPMPPMAIPQTPIATPPGMAAGAWATPYQQQPARGSSTDVPVFDMGGAHMREVLVRRIVWISVIVIAAILVIVVAKLL
ncbi:MAG TPA: protein kinase [Kofleriaceae bacterium]|nr:protein kinase [Kofleriaceae bacterium]